MDRKIGLALVTAVAVSQGAQASETNIDQRVTDLEKELSALKASNVGSSAHLAGYASAGYSKKEGQDGSFDTVTYAPIFHYVFNDRLFFEGELELNVDGEGDTELAMEYANINIEVNDNLIVGAGRFLSPIGQFRQNLHPSWINKLPSAPLGFGHGGAAPLSEVGVQGRGGFVLGGMRSNYAVFVGNGARVEGHGGDLDLELEGKTGTIDGEYSVGGRFGILPLDKLEVGISYMTGEAGYHDEDDAAKSADVSIVGADFVYTLNQMQVRGEYIKAELDPVVLGPDPDEQFGETERETWYLQAAYRLGSNYEAVVRYSDFEPAGSDNSQEQWTLGVNYLLAPQSLVKVAWESNDGDQPAAQDDRLLVQLAYGF